MNCDRLNKFFVNFANKTNIELISILQEKPCNVKTITEITGKEQSAISHNLKRMLDCNIVKVKTFGRERIYSLNKEFILPLFDLVNMHASNVCGKCFLDKRK